MSRKSKAVKEAWDAAPNQPFVSVLKPTMQEPAWKALSYGARCLYIVVKSYYNGRNNGRIYLGVRRAAADMGASRSSTEVWFRELQEHGFLRITQAAHLGIDGNAMATFWRLTELGYMGEQPTRDYRGWTPPPTKKKTPHRKSGQTVTEIGTGCTENRDRCHENRDGFDPKSSLNCPDNRCISNLPSGVGGREDVSDAA
ncbi:helix-turn-helix domain-containing protein [Aureimonas frigidaquae]|uniref:Uncharacterized protein n=1 Tax=Aureimonas frigidaquae TaxID=424757 RepID=A0A0P0Z3M4_9HYPH|nr:hypothetical protein [Aureimonas frigidaquae]BAT28724.1 hypothetical protein [Aureimonas frigidaquae]